LRQHDYTVCDADAPARVAHISLAAESVYASAAIAVAESTQIGIVTFGHEASATLQPEPAVAAFRRQLAALMPMMSLARPPND